MSVSFVLDINGVVNNSVVRAMYRKMCSTEEDKRLAYDKNASYLILSLMDKQNPVSNSFHIEGADAEREDLDIKES